MKLALIGYLHGRGGAERQIVLLANALAERGHDVSLIALSECRLCYPLSDRVRLIDLSGCEREKESIARRFGAYRHTLRGLSPEVSIHFWLQSAYFSALFSKRRCGRSLYAERGDPSDDEYRGALAAVRALAFRRTDGFVFQSKGARDCFKDSVRRRSVVIPNAVAVPEVTVPYREKRIVSVGRLHPQKNQKLLIEAFARIAPELPGYTLEIYGDGELKAFLEKEITDRGLSDRIFLFASRSDILERIASASLFVLSSDYEGMPNALMEAMALGLPCVATDCRPGGARALIEDGVNGYLVPRGDAAALAEKMLWLLKRKERQNAVGKAAEAIRITHSPGAVYDAWERFITSIARKEKL